MPNESNFRGTPLQNSKLPSNGSPAYSSRISKIKVSIGYGGTTPATPEPATEVTSRTDQPAE